MLVELQELDDNLRDLRESKKALDELRTQNAKDLELLDGMLATMEERLGESRSFVDEKAGEIEEKREDMRRARTRMAHITNQRELTAVNKELDSARRGIATNTEELGRLQEQLKASEADFEEKRTARDEMVAQMKAAEAERVATISDLEGHASEFNARRARIRESLRRDLVGRYDRISRGRDGQAVSDVIEGTCGGCNMAVPPQVFIRLQRMETLEQCNSCQRLLVYRDGMADPEQSGGAGGEV